MLRKIFLILPVCCLFLYARVQAQKLKDNTPLPVFSIADVNGNLITNDTLKGKKVLLSFTRNAGCPVCNSYVHQLLEKADSFSQLGIQVYIVSQSSRQNLLNYLQQENFPFRFIPDTSDYLYSRFAIEHSAGKFFKSLFHGGLRQRKAGMYAYKRKPKFEGNRLVIGADFMIDSQGVIRKVHYGRWLGDRPGVSAMLLYFRSLP